MLTEPAPGEVTTLFVLAANMELVTIAGVADGVACKIKAAKPATCGAAIDVPLTEAVAVFEVYQFEVIEAPGANKSKQVP